MGYLIILINVKNSDKPIETIEEYSKLELDEVLKDDYQ